jgi:hypothetical protein
LHLIVHPAPPASAQAFVADLARIWQPPARRRGDRDFTWNRWWLRFCINAAAANLPGQCTGQPLNPSPIQDLVGRAPCAERYQGSPHPPLIGESLGVPVLLASDGRAVIEPETLWACTSCRACIYECPMMIEHVDAIISMRRHQTLELGATPGKGAEALAELKAADNPGGRALASRLDWATDLALPRLADVASADILLWLGDAAFELRGQRTLRSLVRLLRQAKVDFAVIGAEELDCGDIARRLGDEALFQDLARRNIALLASLTASGGLFVPRRVRVADLSPEGGSRQPRLYRTWPLAVPAPQPPASSAGVGRRIRLGAVAGAQRACLDAPLLAKSPRPMAAGATDLPSAADRSGFHRQRRQWRQRLARLP